MSRTKAQYISLLQAKYKEVDLATDQIVKDKAGVESPKSSAGYQLRKIQCMPADGARVWESYYLKDESTPGAADDDVNLINRSVDPALDADAAMKAIIKPLVAAISAKSSFLLGTYNDEFALITLIEESAGKVSFDDAVARNVGGTWEILKK